ncbi:MAG: hypothetical protein ABIB71_05960 [Candidatus Woesearchaeota archaeon]
MYKKEDKNKIIKKDIFAKYRKYMGHPDKPIDTRVRGWDTPSLIQDIAIEPLKKNPEELRGFLAKNRALGEPEDAYRDIRDTIEGFKPGIALYGSNYINVTESFIGLRMKPLFSERSTYETIKFYAYDRGGYARLAMMARQTVNGRQIPDKWFHVYYRLDGLFQSAKAQWQDNNYYIYPKEDSYELYKSKKNWLEDPETLDLVFDDKNREFHLTIGESGKAKSLCLPETMNITHLLEYSIERAKEN